MVSILEEGLVGAQRLLLQEEVPRRTPRVETHQPQHLTLRSEEALSERVNHTESEGAMVWHRP
jgi:hypothetical protein